MLGQRFRRWPNIVQMFYKCFVFTGTEIVICYLPRYGTMSWSDWFCANGSYINFSANIHKISRLKCILQSVFLLWVVNYFLLVGLTVESVDKGINGCLVKSLVETGAVARDGRISVGDYITLINNESMRRITNAQARAILRRASLLSSDIRWENMVKRCLCRLKLTKLLFVSKT